MSDKYDLNPRLYDQLIGMVKNQEPLDPLLARYSPVSIRNMLEQATAQAAAGKHPYDLFEHPELLRDVPIIQSSDPNNYGSASFTLYKDSRLPVPNSPAIIKVGDQSDLATKIHEAQHIYDQRSQLHVPQPIEVPDKNLLTNIKQELEIPRNIAKSSDLRGLEEATAYYASHFKPDVEDKFGKMKQLLNLERVVQGKPLKMIAPVMKAAGIGAMGLAAAGIGQKAMAGEPGQASLEAADLATDFVPYFGQIKNAIRPTEIDGGELPPDIQEEKERFNKTTQRLLNK